MRDLGLVTSHGWKEGVGFLLLFFGALVQGEFEPRSRDANFLACQWKQDEAPFLLLAIGRGDSEIISESGQ